MDEQEREQHACKNASTSPQLGVLSTSSSCRETDHNNCQNGSQVAAYSQLSVAPVLEYPHNFALPQFSDSDNAPNLLALIRLEDENLSNSSRGTGHTSCRNSSQDATCSQFSGAPVLQLPQDFSLPVFSAADTTSNYSDAQRRLEDENISKFRNSGHDTGHNNFRNGSQDAACSQLSGAPVQQYPHDFSLPVFPAGDTTFNSVEDQRRLEYENLSKLRKKQRTNSSPSVETALANNSPSDDVTIVGYCYGRQAVPYRSKLTGKYITLGYFKSMLPKKGNFRYYFKAVSNAFGTGVVFEEVTEDSKVLPLWEGKIFCIIEPKHE